MSTRCQVHVVEERPGGGEPLARFTLYHHTDGYPQYMIPCIGYAWELTGSVANSDRRFEAAHGESVVSFLCAADPGTFQPEQGHPLHGDLAYEYTLYITPEDGGVRWEVEQTMGMATKPIARAPLAELLERFSAKSCFVPRLAPVQPR